MGKKGRIVLYIMSIVVLIGMGTLIFLSHGRRMQEAGNTISDNNVQNEQDGTDSSDILQGEDGASDENSAENQTGAAFTEENTEASDIQNTETDSAQDKEAQKETDSQSGGGTTLIFAGDVLFANAFKSNYDAGGIEKVIEPQLLEQLVDADIFMVNNEFPFSTRGEAMEDKQFTFRCDPKYVTALNEMGVDIVSLANNHTLDFGTQAFSDTFQVLDDAGILYAGAGDTKERAYELQVIEKNGKKFGFLAASRVIPVSNWKVEEQTPGMLTAYDDTKLVALIEETQDACDFLTVYLHWGVEYDAYPQAYQTKIATDCFDAGADLVIGAHTHCLQGVSYINGKPVFYSLGNFVFGQNIDKTMAVKVTVAENGDTQYQLIPVYAAGGMTRQMTSEDGKALYQYVDSISDGAQIDVDGYVIP